MTMTYRELIRRGARTYSDRTAIVFQNQSITFRQTNELANQMAHGLMALGARRGDRLALLVNNGLYSVPLDFACAKAGLNRVPLNARLSVTEHRRMLEDADCRWLVFGADLADRAAELQQQLPELACIGLGTSLVDGDDLLTTAQAMATSEPEVAVAADDVVLTLFTSGTTGTLKAAQHSQASYAAICHNVLLNLVTVAPGDAMLHAASLIHASGVFVLPFWLRGGKTVIMSGFEPEHYLKLIEEHQITAINLVPTMLQMLLEHPLFDQIDTRRLRQVIYGASPMPRPVIEAAMARWGREKFWQYYGQTECPLAIAVLRPEHHQGERLGACGQPALDVEVRLVDEQGLEVPVGQPGEIVVRAPSRMLGYYKTDTLNRDMFLADGWLRTRDIACFDEHGFLHMKDRTSDMIITGGYNVYPREVEDALMTHPAVLECAVVGVRDSKWVEAVTAAVVRRAKVDVSAEQLIDHVGQHLAAYKKPRAVVFLDSIPKTAVGKLDRKTLRRAFNEDR